MSSPPGFGAPDRGVSCSWSWRNSWLLLLFDLNIIHRSQPEVNARLDVAHRAIRPEFLVSGVHGLEFGVEEVVQQGLRRPDLGRVVLEGGALVLVVVSDL